MGEPGYTGCRGRIINQGALHEVHTEAAEHMITGDETALAAATGLLAALPPVIAVTALLEVPTEDDRRGVATSPATVRYFIRNDGHAEPGHPLLDAARDRRPRRNRVVA